VIEHTEFYQREFDVPAGDRGFIIPFGRGRIVRPGSACTVLATSVMVGNALKAVEETGIDAEVIDLRNLDAHGIDWDLIGRSIDRTGRVIIAEQTARSMSMGATWADGIQARFFDSLDHEILRVTGGMAAPTVSAVLNRAALGSAADIGQALLRVTGN
jgi:2-oxoisovalerate dehydrogenase E1 component